PSWKIQYISTRKKDRKPSSTSKITKTTWDIERVRWPSLGFHPMMTFHEARIRAKQLNSQITLKRQEEKIKLIRDEQTVFQNRHSSFLPEEFVSEFEHRFVKARDILPEAKKRTRNKNRFTSWRAAQKIIVAVSIEPSQWFYHQTNFYDVFFNRQMSYSYILSVLSMINLWGHFITRKFGQPFNPVLRPRGYERQRVLEAYYQKTKKHREASKPIVPTQLNAAQSDLNNPNFNWLFISVWFGLRPQEIDQLHDTHFWRIEILPTGRKIFWVYQTKIVALPPEDRWKPIPIIFDEQHFALKIISDGNFRRPLCKTIRKHFGEGHDCYAGRKGFVDLMLSKNQSLENISIWMGHATLNRTWRSYKNKKIYQA
ncbi:MAG: hypothetical protein ACXWRE_09495, partial [Pseudobdellovibrionaceae bacterium]